MDKSATPARALPRSIWALGLVSLFMDMSSEMIHALLPVFLVGTIGLSAFALGMIEGVAEATASITKIFSGVLSDRFGKRKPLVVLGYGLAALTKPLFPLAHHAGLAIAARWIDRVGKGIRGAPRDALVADITPPEQRGAAYGLRQSMDTAGAFLGPLLATTLMVFAAFDVRMIFWIAVIPAFLSLLVLVAFVREPEGIVATKEKRTPLFAGWRRFPKKFWWLMALVLMFTLMRFSEAFLVLRAADAGLATAWLPMTLVVMSATYMVTAYPVGWLSDRMSRHVLLALGCAVMVAADAFLGLADTLASTMIGIGLWGVHMGLTEGLISAMTAEYAPADLRGTAFGLINLARGIMVLLASVLAGALWTGVGAPATFAAGAVAALITAVLALAMRTHKPRMHVADGMA